jgi:hypothetical protein
MLIGFIIVLLIVGIALAMFPIDAQIRKFIIFALAVLFILWLCMALGFIGDYGYVRITR